MEAYFHNDPRIEEWVDQITEKLFTACLLTGVDSEVEFQSGCQIVSKVTNLLQGISIFPSEYLEDGLNQLVEQQLPDSRVINNFPSFQDTMKRMIREGMRGALEAQNKETLLTIEPSEKDIPVKTENDAIESYKEHCEEDTERSVNVCNDEFVTEKVMTALASVVTSMTKTTDHLEAGVGLQALGLAELPLTPTKTYGIQRESQVPECADRLKQVLENFFPNVSVCWNFNLQGQKFLAQVEDILIWLDNPEQSCQVENFNKEGWKVYECRSTDLMFPRRLERGIRQIKRLGKPCRNL